MGVRGLTTYIAKNAERYLEPFELHDCDLVIDGDSLSSNMYKWSSNCNSAFGGNYDQYFRSVCNFFEMLKRCNVKPYVLLDGGYQHRKLKTVRTRLRSKICAIKHLNPFSCKPMFPVMMREVFVEALERCQVQFMRCVFEADDEVAVLARKLNCPVLSYDSDFYIHNVKYIPSVTLTLKVYRRNLTGGFTEEGKRISRKKVVVQEMLEDGNGMKVKKSADPWEESGVKSYHYMDCCMYTIENLVKNKGLSDEMLPLFAVLLGNDYINSSLFRKFYSNISLKGAGKKNTQQGKRIIGILKWLQNQTLDSAITSILGRVEKHKRDWLKRQMEAAMGGYNREECEAYTYFNSKEEILVRDPPFVHVDIDKLNGLDVPATDESDTESADEESSSETLSVEEVDPDDINGAEEPVDEEIIVNEHQECDVFDTYEPPEWIKQMLFDAKLPRFIIDLLYLRLYVNAPQVENFLFPDCNQIAVPILRLIFTILHSPERPEMRYLTRVQRVTDIHFKKVQCVDEDILFDSSLSDNFPTFKLAFKDFSNFEEILSTIGERVPIQYQMYCLSLIYWCKFSTNVNAVHVSSAIICLIVLSVIDTKVEPIRARDKFEKKYRPQLVQQNTVGKKVTPTENDGHKDESETCSLSISELLISVSNLESILAQQHLVVHFEVNGKLRSKHTEFSSTILHAFAELQSVVYQLNTLNTLCGGTLPNVEISNFYNGCFLYNMYVALKERPNIAYFVKTFIFRESPNLFGIYESLIGVLTPFIGCLAADASSKKKKNRNMRKKKLRNAKKGIPAEVDTVPVPTETEELKEHLSESDFEDENNKFSCLLKG